MRDRKYIVKMLYPNDKRYLEWHTLMIKDDNGNPTPALFDRPEEGTRQAYCLGFINCELKAEIYKGETVIISG